jgi:hypothetical protein
MSSNNQRSSRRTRQQADSSESRPTARVSVRSVASDKKTYFVDSSDEDDVQMTKIVSPAKKPKHTNGFTNGHGSKSSVQPANNKASAQQNGSKFSQENVDKLTSITGLAGSEAIELLEACDQSLERAVEIHFGTGSMDIPVVTRKISNNGTNGTNGTKRTHKEICGDMNDAISISDDSNSQSSGKYDNSDGVRAPIAPTFARLCDYDPYSVELPSQKRSRVDGFRNMREEFDEGLSTGSSRKKNFSTLFRPPIELIFAGSFEASKVRACSVNKWVLLNVQSHDDFACKCLNRDLWSDETVQEIIKANFIFNQIYFDSFEGQKLKNIYNIHTYPFIGIIDPRTGEKLIQLQSNKLDSCSFCEKVTSFLCDFEMPNVDDTDVPSNEVVKIDVEDEVVVINDDDKTALSNEYLNNAFNKLMEKKKPQRAEDILNSNNNIFECQDSDSNSVSYEDDTVVSKGKYDKHKQLTFQKSEFPVTSKIENSETILKSEVPVPVAKSVEKNAQPKVIKYETLDSIKKDCFLRVSYPNGDRLDFSTSGDCKLKFLTEYLIKEGFRMDTHELIERLMPTFMACNNKPSTSLSSSENSEVISVLDITEQSRNLFHKDPNLTFKQLKLYPRVALLLQEV